MGIILKFVKYLPKPTGDAIKLEGPATSYVVKFRDGVDSASLNNQTVATHIDRLDDEIFTTNSSARLIIKSRPSNDAASKSKIVPVETAKVCTHLDLVANALQHLDQVVDIIAKVRQADLDAEIDPHIVIAEDGTAYETNGFDCIAHSLTSMMHNFRSDFEQLQHYAELDLKLPTGTITNQAPPASRPLARAHRSNRVQKRRRNSVQGPSNSMRASRLSSNRPSVSAIQQARRSPSEHVQLSSTSMTE